jgi:hypothetical protein
MRPRLVMLGFSAATAVLAGCGQSGSAPSTGAQPAPPPLRDTLVSAAGTTRSAGSARITMAMSESTPSGTMILHGSGLFRLRGPVEGAMHLRADLPVSHTHFVMDERLIGAMLYMRSRRLSSSIPGARPWIAFDLERLGRSAGIDFAGLMNAPGSYPAQSLSYLQAASDGVQNLGSATVDGVTTTHFHAMVDPRRAMRHVVAAAPAAQRASLRSSYRHLFSLTGTVSYPVDAWVDAAGHVRRLRITMALPSSSEPVTMTVGFSAFGAPVHVTPPPAAKTSDLLALVAAARGR